MSAVRSIAPSPDIEGRYVVRRELGRGGFCVVYEAMHRFTERLVALKKPLHHYRRNEEAATRLLLEATALGRVRHPCIVEAFDAGHADGTAYLVMELVEGGRSLEGRLATRGKLGISESVQIVRRVADAIAAAHEAGVIHRDIKPGNVLLLRRPCLENPSRKQTHIKVIDFGVATLIDHPKHKVDATIGGTPEYMPIERLTAADDRHPSSDVYALGVTLYECLAGKVPYAGSYAEVLRLVATSSPEPITTHCPDIPFALAHLIHTAIARDATDRYPDARAFCHALDEVMEEMNPSPPPVDPPEPVRRKHARGAHIAPVRITLDGVTFDASSEDVSERGFMVLTPRLVRPGATGEIRFALPTTGEMVTARLVARWARDNKDRPGGRCALGVELVEPDQHVQRALADYVGFVGALE